jgi:hypothetical protein
LYIDFGQKRPFLTLFEKYDPIWVCFEIFEDIKKKTPLGVRREIKRVFRNTGDLCAKF